jgi:hypothetical protein
MYWLLDSGKASAYTFWHGNELCLHDDGHVQPTPGQATGLARGCVMPLCKTVNRLSPRQAVFRL